jgi:hypothetical protein
MAMAQAAASDCKQTQNAQSASPARSIVQHSPQAWQHSAVYHRQTVTTQRLYFREPFAAARPRLALPFGDFGDGAVEAASAWRR